MASTGRTSAGGRPPKFCEPRRPITVTLPVRVLDKMATVDQDRARAIVKCVEAVTGGGAHAVQSVALAEVAPGQALIVVGSKRSLSRISWLRLIEIAPARFLLVLPSGTPVESLEVAIHDLIRTLGPHDQSEHALLTELLILLGYQRRGKTLSKAELVFVDPSSRS